MAEITNSEDILHMEAINPVNSYRIPDMMVLVGAVLITLTIVEVVLEVVITPSPGSAGEIMGIQLPPLEIIPSDFDEKIATNTEANNKTMLYVDGRGITRGDLWGIYREDGLIGYVPEENTVSVNNWWQSNNIGARSKHDLGLSVDTGKRNVLFFGDSFTHCSRVAQEETFQYQINMASDKYEAVNFGVDGYSTGQSYLRYTQVKDKVNYEYVVLVFVPRIDLARDVSISRNIAFAWDSYKIYPRFDVSDGALKLIPSPYASLQDLVAHNQIKLERKLIEHLQKYEPFYMDDGYQIRSYADWSNIYRLYRAARYNYARSKLREDINRPGSNAMQISRSIAEAMYDEVNRDSAKFAMVFLPSLVSITDYKADGKFRWNWDQMINFFCSAEFECVDLMEQFQNIPITTLDKGYDGTHYGPRTNQLIAEFLMDKILN